MDIPDLNKGEIQESVENTTRNLIPWLENPHQCDCGAYCLATQAFVESQAIYMDVWECPDCDSMYHRTRD